VYPLQDSGFSARPASSLSSDGYEVAKRRKQPEVVPDDNQDSCILDDDDRLDDDDDGETRAKKTAAALKKCMDDGLSYDRAITKVLQHQRGEV
jgi:hypothetical protein